MAACVAPRPMMIVGSPGETVVATLTAAYKLNDAADCLAVVPGQQTDTMAPYAEKIAAWVAEQAKTLEGSDAAPQPCAEPEEPEFDMVAHFQRRIAARAESLAKCLASEAAGRRIGRVCLVAPRGLRAGHAEAPVQTRSSRRRRREPGDRADFARAGRGIHLPCDAGAARRGRPEQTAGGNSLTRCQAVRRERQVDRGRSAVATLGYCVIVPDHASAAPQARQPLVPAGEKSFYGDEASRLYGPADAVGLPPLALRVADDLAAFRHVAARPEVNPQRIVIAGLGLGGVDACLSAVLEDRIAGVASIDATTLRDWAENVAPRALRFVYLAPYLPSMGTKPISMDSTVRSHLDHSFWSG